VLLDPKRLAATSFPSPRRSGDEAFFLAKSFAASDLEYGELEGVFSMRDGPLWKGVSLGAVISGAGIPFFSGGCWSDWLLDVMVCELHPRGAPVRLRA